MAEYVIPEIIFGPLCDFCSSPEPGWDYPAQDFVLRAAVLPNPNWRSEGGWLACEACAVFIEAGDRAELERRCVAVLAAKYHAPPNDLAISLATREAQRGFWTARLGARREIAR